MYSQKVIEHFTNPKNLGKIKNANGVGVAGNPICGDILKLYIKVAKEKRQGGKEAKEIIKEIGFETLGCAAAIATSSMITEMARGKTLDEALKITRGDVAEELEGLPPIKMHCSNLAAEALHNAIADYRNKKSKLANKVNDLTI